MYPICSGLVQIALPFEVVYFKNLPFPILQARTVQENSGPLTLVCSECDPNHIMMKCGIRKKVPPFS